MISIAIDGPAGAGKSSIAKEIAKRFSVVHIDTGAMYRAIALAVINAGISAEDEQAVEQLLKDIDIAHVRGEAGYRVFVNGEDVSDSLRTSEVSYISSIVSGYSAVRTKLLSLQRSRGEAGYRVFVNGEDVSDSLRTSEVSYISSIVSGYSAVRTKLLSLQRSAAAAMSVVMDGRDIGTVVLPSATVKIFLTASSTARAKRRWLENTEKGCSDSLEKVLADVAERDKKDTTREIAPLAPADDAVIIDTTELSFSESVEAVCRCVQEHIH